MTIVPEVPLPTGKRFFSAAQCAQLDVVYEAILPSGKTNPGARDAGASNYVDLLLAAPDDVHYEIAGWRATYTAGLALLNAAAIARFGAGQTLDKLDASSATQLLSDLSAGILPEFPNVAWQKMFFSTLRAHVIEACLADPRWGGNRNGVIWKWLGYPSGGARDFVRP